MIPDGWRYEELNTVIASLEAGVSVNAEDRPKNTGEIGVLKVSAVTYGSFDPLAYKTVLPTEVNRLTVFPKRDSVIVSRANTSQLVGASAYIDCDFPDLFLPDKLWQIRTSDDYSTRWLSYILASDVVRAHMSDRATGTSGSMKNISQEAFLSISVMIPPLAEQRKIAAILSTWDVAITLTGQLIAALQQRKQALMQLLLTGALRFPEFENNWENVNLGEFFEDFSQTNTRNEDLTILSCSKIHGIVPQSVIFDKRIASKDIRRYKVIEKGDFVYDPMLLWDASLGFLETPDRGVISPAYETLRFIGTSGNRQYFKHLFKTHYFRETYKVISQGTNVRRRKAPISAFLKIRFKMSPDLNEQKKIMDVLSACDEHISKLTLLESDLAAQKRGLMQQLLTGALRVQVEA